MKTLKATLLLLFLTTCLYGQDERILVQAHVDKVCINMDTCFMVKAHLSLTTHHFYISDVDTKETLKTDVKVYERRDSDYYIYATNDLLTATILISGTKILVDYTFDNKRFLVSYRVKQKDGKPLIIQL